MLSVYFEESARYTAEMNREMTKPQSGRQYEVEEETFDPEEDD